LGGKGAEAGVDEPLRVAVESADTGEGVGTGRDASRPEATGELEIDGFEIEHADNSKNMKIKDLFIGKLLSRCLFTRAPVTESSYILALQSEAAEQTAVSIFHNTGIIRDLIIEYRLHGFRTGRDRYFGEWRFPDMAL
jgi:hypothetical protein